MKIPKDMIRGTLHETRNYGTLIVAEYKNARDVEVEFISTGLRVNTTSTDIRSGNVKDHMMPIFFGVGFYGKRRSRKEKRDEISYSIWYAMLERCYCPYKINLNKSYADCTVCDEWHNYQNFKLWFNDNYIEGYDIDKDILSNGIKVYSPDTCTFLPRYINNIIDEEERSGGDFPAGVSYRNDRGRFRSYISINGRYKTLGHYDTESEASLAYRKARYEYVKTKCEQCKKENPENHKLIKALDSLIEKCKRKARE